MGFIVAANHVVLLVAAAIIVVTMSGDVFGYNERLDDSDISYHPNYHENVGFKKQSMYTPLSSWAGVLKGTVYGSDNLSVRGVVTLMDTFGVFVNSTQFDSGKFAIDVPYPGPVTLNCSSPGYSLTWLGNTEQLRDAQFLDVDNDKAISNISISLVPAKKTATVPISIRILCNYEGEPIENIRPQSINILMCKVSDVQHGLVKGNNNYRYVASAHFKSLNVCTTTIDLEPAQYYMIVESYERGSMACWWNGAPLSDPPAPLTITGDTINLQIQFKTGAKIKVFTKTDNADTLTAPCSYTVVNKNGTVFRNGYGQNGGVCLIDGLPLGIYYVKFFANGYTPIFYPGVISFDEAMPLTISNLEIDTTITQTFFRKDQITNQKRIPINVTIKLPDTIVDPVAPTIRTISNTGISNQLSPAASNYFSGFVLPDTLYKLYCSNSKRYVAASYYPGVLFDTLAHSFRGALDEKLDLVFTPVTGGHAAVFLKDSLDEDIYKNTDAGASLYGYIWSREQKLSIWSPLTPTGALSFPGIPKGIWNLTVVPFTTNTNSDYGYSKAAINTIAIEAGKSIRLTDLTLKKASGSI